MPHRHVFFSRYLPATTVQMPRRETERARSDGAGAREVGGVEGREVGKDGAGGLGGEEQAHGAVEVRGEEVGVRVGSGGRGAAEGFGHDFCFAEEEALGKRGRASASV